MGLAQDIQDVLDRHVPVEAVASASPKAIGLLREAQNLGAEIMDVADMLEDALGDLRRATARSS
jgi:hypothetical protein